MFGLDEVEDSEKAPADKLREFIKRAENPTFRWEFGGFLVTRAKQDLEGKAGNYFRKVHEGEPGSFGMTISKYSTAAEHCIKAEEAGAAGDLAGAIEHVKAARAVLEA